MGEVLLVARRSCSMGKVMLVGEVLLVWEEVLVVLGVCKHFSHHNSNILYHSLSFYSPPCHYSKAMSEFRISPYQGL